MVFSNEPGFYENNKYGIRIENLVTTKTISINNVKLLKIDDLTLVPYDRDLIKNNLLSTNEKKWLNDYHKNVKNKILPFLKGKERNWLIKVCKEII